MNIGPRIEAIRKIVQENSNTYDRLIRVKSNFETSKLKEEHKEHLKRRKMIQGNGRQIQDPLQGFHFKTSNPSQTTQSFKRGY